MTDVARYRLGFWALAAGLGLAQVVVHARAGFGFPPPWIDEAQFLWQAIAVADTGTLLAPQLDPARPVLWMPPGWFFAMGAAFKLLGFAFTLFWALLWLAFIGFIFYLILRLFSPSTADQVRDAIKGRPGV